MAHSWRSLFYGAVTTHVNGSWENIYFYLGLLLLRFPVGGKDFSLFQIFHSISGAHTVSLLIGTKGSSPRIKAIEALT
jgi:hypothetical protein